MEIKIQINRKAKPKKCKLRLNLKDVNTKELFGEKIKLNVHVVENAKLKLKQEKLSKSVVKIHDIIGDMNKWRL